MSKRGRPAKGSEPSAKKKVKGGLDTTLAEDIANWLRIDSIRSVNVSKSGHPTSCSSIAQVISVLFFTEQGLKFHHDKTAHFLNDRIVLSKGHAAPILYSALYRSKVLTEEQLMSLRLKDSIIEGHPVPKIPFVDVATGSLGQGLSVAAGMAYSSKHLDKIDNRIFCITGDGEMAEGSIWEAADFAQNYELNNLTLFVDVNRLGQSQQTMFGHQTDVFKNKFNSFGWNAIVVDGHSVSALLGALDKARKQTKKPTAIICKTLKGKGFGEIIENQLDWHGKNIDLGQEELLESLKSRIRTDNIEFKTFAPEGDEPAIDLGTVMVLPTYEPGAKISTRKAYGQGLKKARQSNPNVVGLDGDTKNSTFAITLMKSFPESFIECFIAEQNLVGVTTGLSCRKKIAFCSTFAAFFIRAADQIRIAGIGSNPIKLAGSHSGCSIGEDGPSQMALEDLGFFRNIPKGVVVVPSDGVSAERAVELVANYNEGPAFIRTSRPDVSILYSNEEVFELGKCKVVKSSEEDKLVVITFGVLVHESLKAYEVLAAENIKIRVVDIFSLKPFDSDGIRKNIEECGGKVVVAEEHYEAGGAYEAVCGAAVGAIKQIRHLCVTKIPGSAKPTEQLEIQGLDSKSIEARIRELL